MVDLKIDLRTVLAYLDLSFSVPLPFRTVSGSLRMSCCPLVAPEEGIPNPAEGPKERMTGTDDPTLVEKAATFFF